MPVENKSFREMLAGFTADQKKEVTEKMEVAYRRIFQEGVLPYKAFDMPEEVLEYIYSEAYRHYKSGLYEKAQQYFEMLMFLNPTESRFLLGHAACLQMQKQYLVAIQSYFLVGQLMPDSPLPFFYIYECCTQLNQPEEARFALEQVVRLCDLDPDTFAEMQKKAKLMLESHHAHYSSKEGAEESNESLREKL